MSRKIGRPRFENRNQVLEATTSLRLPQELIEALDARVKVEAKENPLVTKAEIIRKALAFYLAFPNMVPM